MLFMKSTCVKYLYNFMLSASVIRPEKVILFPEIDQVKIFLSLTHPHVYVYVKCVSEYIYF